MSASSTVAASTPRYGHAFWERLWRSAGIQSVGLFVVAYVLCGMVPPVGAPPGALMTFYEGARTSVLIAAALCGLAILNLTWFAASIRVVLADAGQEGWGSAATAASAAVAALLLLPVMIGAVLAFSVAQSADQALASALNDLVWAGFVMSSFPRAMLIMAGSLGLWRAGLISNGLFAAGVGAIVLVLAGGTTWMSGGFWSPDGLYSSIISPVIGLVWVTAMSAFLLFRVPAARSGW
ncbi:MAG: hypothetical protein JOZ72_04655 [Alphaproteobacteria bacterium]|nr:hypothetical protein [Alphaproteobacteria bacterium]